VIQSRVPLFINNSELSTTNNISTDRLTFEFNHVRVITSLFGSEITTFLVSEAIECMEAVLTFAPRNKAKQIAGGPKCSDLYLVVL
jgi:hypothetical protein